MKKQILLSTLVLLTSVSFSQNIPMGQYEPENELVRKSLTLYRASTFKYFDVSDGCCFGWFDISGKWKIEKDELILTFKNMFDSTCTKESRFIIGANSLEYADNTDKNLFTNWGTFIFPGYGRAKTKAGLNAGKPFSNYPNNIAYYEMKRYECSGRQQ